INNANKLKELTDGKINLYKTGTFKNAALKLFHDFNELIQPEPILQAEGIWIKEAMKGPLVWATKYKGDCYEYDVVSMYPSIMRDQKFSVPIKAGIFKKLTQDEFDNAKYYEYG